MSKQITFPGPMTVTKVYPDGTHEQLQPRYPVTEVECEDGTKLVFDEPFYYIEIPEKK